MNYLLNMVIFHGYASFLEGMHSQFLGLIWLFNQTRAWYMTPFLVYVYFSGILMVLIDNGLD